MSGPYERALFCDADKLPATSEVREADLVIVGNTVVKARYGRAGMTLSDEDVAKLKSGDYSPLVPRGGA